MVSNARKLHLIEELLKIQSEKVLAEVEAILKKASASTVEASELSDKFASKLSSSTARKLQKHVVQSRKEWERDI